ncbi:GDP-mannose 4,6-dehydratase [bacterium]|nr:GDP-mannose 4,6-dehydratase [bacterium]
MKKVLITGILGQDGSNMAEYLLSHTDNLVYGMMRKAATPSFENIESFNEHSNFNLVYGDLTDEVSINELVKNIQPDYFINFAAASFVSSSWSMPVLAFDINALGALRCLEAIRNFKPDCRFYSAGSSEEFGNVDYSPQDISHPFKPRSPYGASKCAAHHIVKVYRESHDIYAVHGILFNHEGIRRGKEFVTRKITSGVARIYHKVFDVEEWRHRHGGAAKFAPIELGNIDAKRDWSDSEDFVRGIWLMLNQENSRDYLLASGEMHSIREFVEKAFSVADLKGHWEGGGVNEKYIHDGHHKLVLVKINPDFYRPAEVEQLMGDASETYESLSWRPEGNLDTLVEKMVKHDMGLHRKNRKRLSQINS